MTIEKLRRYSSINELHSILQRNALTFYDQTSWDDTNDVCYIQKFKSLKNYSSVLVKCFAEAEETFLMWKAYTGKKTGVCIEFDRANLLNKIDSPNIISGYVKYPTIENRQAEPIRISELPFQKRYPYRAEKEFRIIYFSDRNNITTIEIPINRSCISRVLLSPWMSDNTHNIRKEEIQSILGWENLDVANSSVLSNKAWKDAVENIENN